MTLGPACAARMAGVPAAPDMDASLLTNLPFLAVAAPLILFWGQAKDLLTKVVRLFIVEAQVHSRASEAVMYYLREHGRKVPTNILKYSSRYEFIKAAGREKMLAYEAVRDLSNQWYWHAGNLVTISDKHGKDKDTGISYDRAITLRYLRGTIDIETLIKDAIKWYEAMDSADSVREFPRFYVRRLTGSGGRDTENARGTPQTYSSKNSDGGSEMAATYEDWKYSRLLNYSISDIGYAKRDFFYVFNPTTQSVKDDVERWLKAKDWYSARGLLWRRGSLLSSVPGAGKSSLIRKIGQSLDLPVLAFDLSTMNDIEFIRYWSEVRYNQPCIVVMEDIDTVFHRRDPANPNIKLSFECLLNCISGVEPAEGIYLFVTTNRLDQLDEALGVPNARGVSTRPGRLDTCFEMGDITVDEKREIVNHFLADHADIGAALIESSNGCTAAQFSDMCSQKALELYWTTHTT